VRAAAVVGGTEVVRPGGREGGMVERADRLACRAALPAVPVALVRSVGEDVRREEGLDARVVRIARLEHARVQLDGGTGRGGERGGERRSARRCLQRRGSIGGAACG
jgi:hypothetical protein